MNGFAPRVFPQTLSPQTVSRPGDMPAATPAVPSIVTPRLVSVPLPLSCGGVGVGSAPDPVGTPEMVGGPGGHDESDGNRSVSGGGGSEPVDGVCESEPRTAGGASGCSAGSPPIHRRQSNDRVVGGVVDSRGESGGGLISPLNVSGLRKGASLGEPQPPAPGAVGREREGGEHQVVSGETVSADRRHPEDVGAESVIRATVADVEAAADAALEADGRSKGGCTSNGDHHAAHASNDAGAAAVRMTTPIPPVPTSMVLPTTNNGPVGGWLPPSTSDNRVCSGSPCVIDHQRPDECGGGVHGESGGGAATVSGKNVAAAVSSSAMLGGDSDAHVRVALVGGGSGSASLERVGAVDGGGGLPRAPPASAALSVGSGGSSSNGHLGPYAIGSASNSGHVYGTTDVALAPPNPGVVCSGGNDGGGSVAGVGVHATAGIGAGSLRVVKVTGNGGVFHGADELHSSRTRKLGDRNEESSRTRELPLGRDSPPVTNHVAPTTNNNGCQPGQAVATPASHVKYFSGGSHSPRQYRRGAAVTPATAAAVLYTATHHPHVSSPDATLQSPNSRPGGPYIAMRGRGGAGPGGGSRGGPGRGTDGRSLKRAAPSGAEGRGGAGLGGAMVGYGSDMNGRSALADGGSSCDGGDGSGGDVHVKKKKSKGPYADVGFVSWRSGGTGGGGSCSNANNRTAGYRSRGQQVPVAPPPALAAFKPLPAATTTPASSTAPSAANGGRNRGGHGTTKMAPSRDGSSGQQPRPGPGRPRSSTAAYAAPASVAVSKNGLTPASSPSSESTATAPAAAFTGSFAATASEATAAAMAVSGVGGAAAATTTTMMMTMGGGLGAVTGAVAGLGNPFRPSVADGPGLRDEMDVVVDAAAATGHRTSPRLMHFDAAGNVAGAYFGGVDNRTVGDLAVVGPGSVSAVANNSTGALVAAQDGRSSPAGEGGGSDGGIGGGTAGFVNAVRSVADSGMKVVLRRG